MATLQTPLVKVLGDKTAKALAAGLGEGTVEALLRHYPRRYVERGQLSDISALNEGDETTVMAEIASTKIRRAQGKVILEVQITDGRASMVLTFFNQAWREKELAVGRSGLFAGKVSVFNGKRQLSHPDYELLSDEVDPDSAATDFAGKLIPIYPSIAKLPTWKFAKCVEIVLDALESVEDFLPEEICAHQKLVSLETAMRSLHAPKTMDEVRAAKHRLTFDEAFILQTLLAKRRAESERDPATARIVKADGLMSAFEARLPWSYTEGQVEVNKEIEKDLAKAHPMHRLLQGEVGSGKTVIALRSALIVVDSGGQAALLAPTEVLASQHYSTIKKMLGELSEAGTLTSGGMGTHVDLLTSSTPPALRKQILARIASGEAGIVIGTHSLIQESVEFHDLGIVIIDEQHRFGVEQRDALRAKGRTTPHMLVMTATPIPRTVAMTVFGDLDVSTLRTLPHGRQPIITHVIPVREKPLFVERAWERIKEEVAKGHQAYVVTPRISEGATGALSELTDEEREIAKLMGDLVEEESSKTPMCSVEALAPELATGPLKGLKVAILHGRLPAIEKEETMLAFGRGEIDVLVSTTVIEVGVDVPNATMMVIMDADRFGVSQLHQLRGRVGRGGAQGLCLLISSSLSDSPAMERLNAVASTTDGFALAQIDLEHRSEGDVLGSVQSGKKSHLKLLRVLEHENLIADARSEAMEIIQRDAELLKFPLLAREIEIVMAREESEFMEKG